MGLFISKYFQIIFFLRCKLDVKKFQMFWFSSSNDVADDERGGDVRSVRTAGGTDGGDDAHGGEAGAADASDDIDGGSEGGDTHGGDTDTG